MEDNNKFIAENIKKIREKVGNDKVLCALSGGVDSAVVAALLHRAIGDKLICMFVDHGLLRANEADFVVDTFDKQFHMNLIKVEAQEYFINKLKGVSDPEEKRKIIGREFITVFERESAKLKDVKYLAQGTIYADIIESGVGNSKLVKSHHNVGGLPKDLKFSLVEPIKMLFKDEVRELGEELGLSRELCQRQPFPGPGLAVRVLGEVTKDKLEMLRAADLIVREEIDRANIAEAWQYFAVLPNISSTGVRDGKRSYEQLIVVRAVSSIDAMKADWLRLPYDVLNTISLRITNEVKGVSRIAYDITSKPPGTIEWE
jgi:GMP synthase (glutamine-hydrolysing)